MERWQTSATKPAKKCLTDICFVPVQFRASIIMGPLPFTAFLWHRYVLFLLLQLLQSMWPEVRIYTGSHSQASPCGRFPFLDSNQHGWLAFCLDHPSFLLIHLLVTHFPSCNYSFNVFLYENLSYNTTFANAVTRHTWRPNR